MRTRAFPRDQHSAAKGTFTLRVSTYIDARETAEIKLIWLERVFDAQLCAKTAKTHSCIRQMTPRSGVTLAYQPSKYALMEPLYLSRSIWNQAHPILSIQPHFGNMAIQPNILTTYLTSMYNILHPESHTTTAEFCFCSVFPHRNCHCCHKKENGRHNNYIMIYSLSSAVSNAFILAYR